MRSGQRRQVGETSSLAAMAWGGALRARVRFRESTAAPGRSGDYLGGVEKQEILIAFGGGRPRPLGNIWRITAKKTDFYLQPHGLAGFFHLSAHGPNDVHPDGHRFHVRLDAPAAAKAARNEQFVAHGLPEGGQSFDGQRIADEVFRVARIRWLPELAAPEYEGAASYPKPLPELNENKTGFVQSAHLGAGEVADIDLVVSYGEPYWPGGERSLLDNARLEPLKNDSGMWLTAVAFHRKQVSSPTPEDLTLPLPASAEDARRILGGGPVRDGDGDMYWFVEGITSRQYLEDWREPDS